LTKLLCGVSGGMVLRDYADIVFEVLPELAAYEAELNRAIAAEPVFTLKQLAVNGNDLIAAGFAPGKEIGAALRQLLGAVMDGICENEKGALLRYLDGDTY
jgi:hypothetical protein